MRCNFLNLEFIKPDAIETRSFAIIEEKLKNINIPENQKLILKRVIHTTADFDYIENLKFSEHAVETALQALQNGANIITDTNMALSGINKKSLHALGGEAYCFMSDSDVAEQAKAKGVTRAMISMEKACYLKGDLIFAIGNAPTALYKLADLI
ncbi:MAG: precorrin-8X methylmutase, partial [Oscillospiraceae bacterium]|nr:precorrin-8X methylmutase [Oscillospiraceae bacterium]